MKNLHLIRARKSRLYYTISMSGYNLNYDTTPIHQSSEVRPQNIYITSDEEIKEGIDQWYLDKVLNEPYNSGGAQYSSKQDIIILTTDQDLIKDGVQAIDDNFLEWFVKNPNCESVEVSYELLNPFQTIEKGYVLRLPDNDVLEEPKQETLEQAAEKYGKKNASGYFVEPKIKAFTDGANWQKEQDEAKYKELLDSHNELLNYIKSDSVYNLLRRGVKSPSSTGMDDCNDSNYFDLYTISTNLRNQQS